MKRVITCLALAISVTMTHAQVAPRVPASSQMTGVSGSGHTLVTVHGNPVGGNCPEFDPAGTGDVIDSGAACGGNVNGADINPSSTGQSTPGPMYATNLHSSGPSSLASLGVTGNSDFGGTSTFHNPLLIPFSASYACLVCFNSDGAPATYNTGWFVVTGGGTDLRAIVNGSFPFSIQGGGIVIGGQSQSVGLYFQNFAGTGAAELIADTSTYPMLDIQANGLNTNGALAATLMTGGSSAFSVAGCGTVTNVHGGLSAGKFTAGSSTCTPVVTMGNSISAAQGWTCWISDRTTGTASFRQTADTTTTATFTAAGAVVSGDVISFGCEGMLL